RTGGITGDIFRTSSPLAPGGAVPFCTPRPAGAQVALNCGATRQRVITAARRQRPRKGHMNPNAALPIAIVVVVPLIWLFNCLNILREYERAVVFRLGRVLKKEKGPGLVLILWPIDKVVRVSLRVVTWDV